MPGVWLAHSGFADVWEPSEGLIARARDASPPPGVGVYVTATPCLFAWWRALSPPDCCDVLVLGFSCTWDPRSSLGRPVLWGQGTLPRPRDTTGSNGPCFSR